VGAIDHWLRQLSLQVRKRPRGRYADGRLFSRKAAIVVYGATRAGDSPALLATLGKHTTGKGCLYIKNLADVDSKVLEGLLVESLAEIRARYPSKA